MAATPPRGQKQYGRGEVSKDLETKGNAKKNLKRRGGKIRNGAKIQGRTSKGGTSSRKRRRNGGEQREGGGKEWSGSGGRTFPECHRGGGDLNCAGNKMEMRVVEWRTGGGMK